MKQRLTRRVAVIAGTTVLALSGGAYAIAQGGDPATERKAFLNDAANRLNVSPEELTKALQGAAADRLDQAVKDGKLTQAQADAIKKRMQQDGGVPFLGPPPGGPGGPGGGPGVFRHRGPPPGIAAAAKYLGLSQAELRKQLMSGKSLADVAKAENKSVDGLKDAIKAAITADIKKAVDDKKLTQAQADEFLKDLDARVDEKVTRKGDRGPGGPGHRHGRPGFGPPPPGFGPPPGDAAPAPPPSSGASQDG
jgi:hypothetical protein